MSAAVKTIARLGVLAAGVTIAFATVAQSAGTPKSATASTAATAPATVTPTPKPGQIVPTSPTPATTGAMAMPGGPESAATASAAGDPAKVAAGKELFVNFSCGSCHSLADAGADGHVGPALDGDKGLNHALVVDRVTNGQGPMPAFAGQMTEDEIQNVATYVVTAAQK